MDQFIEKVKEYAAKARTESTKLGKQAYDKANNAIASTKLSFAINETDGKIKEIYQHIGKTMYDKYLAEGDAIEDIKEACESIDELYKEKLTLKEKKAELKNSVTCGECGAYNKPDAAYCSGCGAKLSSFAAEDEVDPTFVDEEVEDVKDKIKDDLKDAADDIKDKMDDVVDAVKEKLPNEVKEKAEDIKDKANDVVESVRAKIPNEVKEKAEDIMDRVEDTADMIEEKVKKVIKIKPRKPADE